MKQKKRIWWTFNLWEADAFQQYLEEMALQGWFLENVGGSIMKFYRAQPEKRRYAALLVPGSSSLTGADSWKAEQFRKECQEAGWDFQCSGTYWQIFYTTDESVKLTGDMTEERQFLIQKALSWNGSAKISYPVLVVLSLWSLYSNLQNPGKMFADPVALMLNPLLLGICISWTVTYARLFRWNCGNTMAIKEGRPFPRMNLQRKVSFKKRIILLDEILILAVLALAFSSSMRALAGTMLSSILIVVISLFVRNLLRNNGSGNARDDWMPYAVGVGVLCMILIPLCNAAATHFLGADEPDTGRKHTVFASYQANDVQMSSSGKSVGVTVYTSPISWIIAKTSKCYPKDMTKWWDQMELELPAELGEVPEGTEVSWCRYMVRKDGAEPVSEENFYQDEPTLDEVILKDRNRLVVLDYGGGMNLTDMKEAVDVFYQGQTE